MSTSGPITVQEAAQPKKPYAATDKIARYDWKIEGTPPDLKYIAKTLLLVDERYQRQANSSKVIRIASAWSWPSISAISVAKRSDGKYYAFDGQYRILAALHRQDIDKLPCAIHEMANVKSEARAFLRIQQNRKPVTTIEKFRAMLFEGNKQAKLLDGLMQETGREAVMFGPNSVRCLGELMSWAEKKPDSLSKLFPLLDLLCEGKPIHVYLAKAFYYIECRLTDGQSLSASRWRNRMIDIGYDELIEAMKKEAAHRGSSSPLYLAEGLLDRINKGLRQHLELG